MKELLSTLPEVAGLVFAAASLLAVGFGHTVREMIGPLRHPRGGVGALVAPQGFEEPGILLLGVISSLVGLALLFPAARILRRRLARHAAVEAGSDIGNET